LVRAVDPRRLTITEVVHLVEAVDILLRNGTLTDLSSVRTESLLRMLSRASRPQLCAVVDQPRLRDLVLDEAVRRIPERLVPARAADVHAVLHWKITGGTDDYDRLQILISNGTCVASRNWDGIEPDVQLTSDPADALRVVARMRNAPGAFLGRRVAVRGDLRVALQLFRCFDLSKK